MEKDIMKNRSQLKHWDAEKDDNNSVDTVDNANFVNVNNNNNNNINHINEKDIHCMINHHNGGSSTCNTLKKSKTAFKQLTVAKIFGKNYDIKKSLVYKNNKPIESPKPQRKTSLEKFYGLSWEDGTRNKSQQNQQNNDNHEKITENIVNHYGPKPFKTLSRSVGKLLRRNQSSVNISIPDPEYKVAYLGNVLTAWAKGEI